VSLIFVLVTVIYSMQYISLKCCYYDMLTDTRMYSLKLALR